MGCRVFFFLFFPFLFFLFFPGSGSVSLWMAAASAAAEPFRLRLLNVLARPSRIWRDGEARRRPGNAAIRSGIFAVHRGLQVQRAGGNALLLLPLLLRPLLLLLLLLLLGGAAAGVRTASTAFCRHLLPTNGLPNDCKYETCAAGVGPWATNATDAESGGVRFRRALPAGCLPASGCRSARARMLHTENSAVRTRKMQV